MPVCQDLAQTCRRRRTFCEGSGEADPECRVAGTYGSLVGRRGCRIGKQSADSSPRSRVVFVGNQNSGLSRELDRSDHDVRIWYGFVPRWAACHLHLGDRFHGGCLGIGSAQSQSSGLGRQFVAESVHEGNHSSPGNYLCGILWTCGSCLGRWGSRCGDIGRCSVVCGGSSGSGASHLVSGTLDPADSTGFRSRGGFTESGLFGHPFGTTPFVGIRARITGESGFRIASGFCMETGSLGSGRSSCRNRDGERFPGSRSSRRSLGRASRG